MDVIFPDRRLRVCVWNATPNTVSASLGSIEIELKRLATVQLVTLKALDDPNLMPCDLLVAMALYIDEENFADWLRGVEARVARQGGIRIPVMIFAKVSESIQRGLVRAAVQSNWYFDIVDPEHVKSLPIRAANFLRLHDHLHEIRRMDEQLATLTQKVISLEENLLNELKDAKGDAL